MPGKTAAHDPDDLEELFDSIVAANAAEANPAALAAVGILSPAKPVTTPGNEVDSNEVLNQIGHIARTLHNTLRELGMSKEIEKAASSIPDARDRLNYVATLTQRVAERVLHATDAAQPVLEMIEVESHRLSGQWQMLFEKKLDVVQFKNLVEQTHAFLYEVPRLTKETNAYLLDIMMAQDFQELSGQVIKKIIAATQTMEQQLLTLLVENAPSSVKAELKNGNLLTGPVVNPKGHTEVVISREQVDDLLENLGF